MTPKDFVLNNRRSRRVPITPLRSGFTLLETLLALGLTTLLMASIVGSVTLYAQYRYRGLEGARQAKILAGTLDDLRNDLRACYSLVVSDSDQVSDSGEQGGETSASASSGIAQERVLAFAARRELPIQFVGRANALLIVRQGTNARFGPSELDPMANQYQVLWLAPGVTTVRLPYATEQQRPLERGYQVPTEFTPNQPALHRCSTPLNDRRFAREAVPGNRRTTDASWDKNIEIKELKLRYFDGIDWRNEWNSHLQQHRLPLAVELQMKFAYAPEQSLRVVLGVPQ